MNFWYDLEGGGAVSFDPTVIKYFLESPFYVSVGHSAYILYSSAIKCVASIVDPDLHFLPKASTWGAEFRKLQDENVMWHDPEPSTVILPEFGTKAIFEGQASKPNEGDYGFLSIWKPNIDRDLRHALFLPKPLQNENPWLDTSNSLHDFMEKQTTSLGKEKKPQLDLLNRFLCNQFIHGSKPYTLTSWLSTELLYSYSGIDFILYPSVLTNSHFYNFAIHPNVVDNFLKLDKVLQFQIEIKAENKIKYSIGRIGEQYETNIQWREPTLEEAQIFPGIIEEGI